MARPKNPPPAVGAELEALQEAWAERGAEAIRTIREADPSGFVRLIAEAAALGDLDS